ncbi:hypothetical protein NQ315_015992 [Exocentrus adspersus]|uniref:MADF domain-containing protein n=1 Tax=Exocentrus adspersus TaxID=1586481 RepID=A0AAV8VL75_9CUCU|nr:hypothetical protein NQ315_015992 [Exocentrus adspersus]
MIAAPPKSVPCPPLRGHVHAAMTLTIKLIECVKANPILYDTDHPDHRNLHRREKVWKDIGKELKEDGEELKKKWKNIKDCYQKHLRTLNSKSIHITPKRSYRNWQWAPLMEFCRKQTEASIKYSNKFGKSRNDAPSEPERDREEETACETAPSSSWQGTKRKREETAVSVPSRKQLIYTADAIDLIFLGYSNTIKSFSPTRQATVKMKIARVIMEEELKNLEEASIIRVVSKATEEETGVFDDEHPCSSSTDTVKYEELSVKSEIKSEDEDEDF